MFFAMAFVIFVIFVFQLTAPVTTIDQPKVQSAFTLWTFLCVFAPLWFNCDAFVCDGFLSLRLRGCDVCDGAMSQSAMSLCPSVSLRLCGEKRRPHRSFSRYSAAIRSSSISSTVSPQRAKEKSFSICEVVTIPQTRPRSSKTGPPDEPE